MAYFYIFIKGRYAGGIDETRGKDLFLRRARHLHRNLLLILCLNFLW